MNKKWFFILMTPMLFFVSCSKNSDFWGTNVNPNALSDQQVVPSILLTPAQLNLAFQQGGDLFRYTSIMINTQRGADRQFLTYDNYIFTSEDFNNVWNNLYSQTLKPLATLYELSNSKGYNHYAGIARVLSAYTYSMVTDLWGDIPFEDALQGPKILQPKYNTQELVYQKCIAYIDQAIELLGKSAGDIKPGTDDVIYGGKADKWLKFAYTLKMRLLTHLSDKVPANIDLALALLPNVMKSNDDNALFSFTRAKNGNPIYQYFEQRGDISVKTSHLYTEMEKKADSRLAKWYDGNIVGNFFASKESSVPLITLAEAQFLEAELNARKNVATDAKSAFDKAIATSFEYATATQGAYLGTWDATSLTTMLNSIAYEKYVALFTNTEAFTDWRRFDYPAFPSNTGSVNDLMYRFFYPTSETLYNEANVPKNISKSTKVWWDIK